MGKWYIRRAEKREGGLTVLPSIGIPGGTNGTEPVAMMIFLAVTFPPTSTRPAKNRALLAKHPCDLQAHGSHERDKECRGKELQRFNLSDFLGRPCCEDMCHETVKDAN